MQRLAQQIRDTYEKEDEERKQREALLKDTDQRAMMKDSGLKRDPKTGRLLPGTGAAQAILMRPR